MLGHFIFISICNSIKTNRSKGYIREQLVFDRYMIPLIKNNVDWRLIRKQNQMQINKDNIHKNMK